MFVITTISSRCDSAALSYAAAPLEIRRLPLLCGSITIGGSNPRHQLVT